MNEEEKKAIEYFKKYINDEEKKLGKNLTTKFNEHLKVLLDKVDKQQKEIEEKTTIIMAGAEKVKQLEKEIEELKLITRQYNSYCINTDDDEPRIILAHKDYFDSGVFVSNYISKDRIREWLDRFDIEEDLQDKYDELLGSEAIYKFLKELLKGNDK